MVLAAPPDITAFQLLVDWVEMVEKQCLLWEPYQLEQYLQLLLGEAELSAAAAASVPPAVPAAILAALAVNPLSAYPTSRRSQVAAVEGGTRWYNSHLTGQ